MRLGFLQNSLGEIVSAIVPASSMPAVLMEGDQLTLMSSLELGDLGVVIAAGVTATVIWHCLQTGAVELEFDHPIQALMHLGWNNTLLLVPYQTEDLLSAFNAATQRNPNCAVSVMEIPTPTRASRAPEPAIGTRLAC